MFLGRVVGTGDPAWLDTDREYALAWHANRSATCPGCGTRADEWAEDEDAYISDHVTCEGCARKTQEEQQNLDKDPQGKVLPGQHVFLTPREHYKPRLPEPPTLDDDPLDDD